MPAVPFESLPDDARVWVFGSAAPISGEAAERLIAHADAFVDGWHAHGSPVIGGHAWRHDHFLLVAADEAASGVSGCSIDSLFRSLRQVESELGATLLDGSLVWYRDADGEVEAASRADFRALVQGGIVSEETRVFDNTVATVGGVRAGEWERPLRESWHGRAFTPVR